MSKPADSPKQLGSFKVMRLIGEGGMASIYEAVAADGSTVAVKLTRSELEVDPELRARFLREARLANAIEHPAAVPIREAGCTPDGRMYLVMELLRGHSLEELRLAAGGTLSVQEVTRTALELLDFLQVAHAAGILHRDVKPSNLFRTVAGDLKVLDLGIGVAVHQREHSTIRTELGSVLGTPAFMSPEHARGHFDRVDARSDLWSVGATLFTLLTGRPVHEGETSTEQLGFAMILPARSISLLLPNLPPHLINAIDGALSYDPDMRWQSAPRMREVLEGLEVPREVSIPASNQQRESGPAFINTVVSTSGVAAGGAAFEPPAPVRLPSEISTFIGRTKELDQLQRLIHDARLVTVTGPGGSGKTRLALRVAHRARAAYSERVYFVPLELVADPSLVAPAIAATLKLRELPQHSAIELLAEHLANARTLIVLDNFEHLRGAAPVLSRLLERAPRLHLLVTSRAMLRLSGEHLYEVPTLAVPSEPDWNDVEKVAAHEAVQLFVQRARAADATFELTPENAGAVASIVSRVDGLPMAIELAAARLRLWTPASLAQRLSNSFEPLRLGPRDAPQRQRTLRDTLAWSYALLNPIPQGVLRQLGCFVGDFSLDAAEAIVEVEDQAAVPTAIEELVEFSLVQRRVVAEQPRLRLLETVRRFALELDSEAPESKLAREASRVKREMAALGRRHLVYYLKLAETLEPLLTREGQREALQKLELERANLAGALDYCLRQREFELGLRLLSATWRSWHAAGRTNEARSWLDRFLDMGGSSDSVRARALSARAGLAYWQGGYQDAYRVYDRALNLYRKLEDKKGEAETLFSMSTTSSWQGDPERGDQLARAAQAIFEELGAREEVGKVLMARGFARWMQGRLTEARPLWEASRSIAVASGDRIEAGTKSLALASLSYLEGRQESALRQAMGALVELVELQNHAFIVMALDWVAAIGAIDDPERALMLAGAAHQHRDELGGGMLTAAVGLPDPRDTSAARLCPEEITELWSKGGALSIAEAVALAQAWHEEL